MMIENECRGECTEEENLDEVSGNLVPTARSTFQPQGGACLGLGSGHNGGAVSQRIATSGKGNFSVTSRTLETYHVV